MGRNEGDAYVDRSLKGKNCDATFGLEAENRIPTEFPPLFLDLTMGRILLRANLVFLLQIRSEYSEHSEP